MLIIFATNLHHRCLKVSSYWSLKKFLTALLHYWNLLFVYFNRLRLLSFKNKGLQSKFWGCRNYFHLGLLSHYFFMWCNWIEHHIFNWYWPNCTASVDSYIVCRNTFAAIHPKAISVDDSRPCCTAMVPSLAQIIELFTLELHFR